jgi:hypothetical protein
VDDVTSFLPDADEESDFPRPGRGVTGLSKNTKISADRALNMFRTVSQRGEDNFKYFQATGIRGNHRHKIKHNFRRLG